MKCQHCDSVYTHPDVSRAMLVCRSCLLETPFEVLQAAQAEIDSKADPEEKERARFMRDLKDI